MASFAETIEDWVNQSEARQLAVARSSAQELAEEANKPQPKGGRMPVDTGFLRNSLQARRNGMPRGRGQRNKGEVPSEWDSGAIALTLQRLQAGDRLVLGWVANYAEHMEARYMFMRSAAQNWPQIVDSEAKRIRREVTGGNE